MGRLGRKSRVASAREARRYQIGTDLEVRFGPGFYFAPTCFLQAWLEGRSLDQHSVLIGHPTGNDANAILVLDVELQAGLYRLRVWTRLHRSPKPKV